MILLRYTEPTECAALAYQDYALPACTISFANIRVHVGDGDGDGGNICVHAHVGDGDGG